MEQTPLTYRERERLRQRGYIVTKAVATRPSYPRLADPQRESPENTTPERPDQEILRRARAYL